MPAAEFVARFAPDESVADGSLQHFQNLVKKTRLLLQEMVRATHGDRLALLTELLMLFGLSDEAAATAAWATKHTPHRFDSERPSKSKEFRFQSLETIVQDLEKVRSPDTSVEPAQRPVSRERPRAPRVLDQLPRPPLPVHRELQEEAESFDPAQHPQWRPLSRPGAERAKKLRPRDALTTSQSSTELTLSLEFPGHDRPRSVQKKRQPGSTGGFLRRPPRRVESPDREALTAGLYDRPLSRGGSSQGLRRLPAG
mmetsp:Transcript_14401/g.31821  ORF Transcript_14401/g.31821 Transcript_14401/m.31821 type:complete len:255 (+) Transcript_14401:1077-1841(+)